MDMRDPSTTTLGDVMQGHVVTIHGDDELVAAAARMMQHRVRHLPVVDGENHVIGMLADRDIRTAIGDPRRAVDDDTIRAHVRDLRVWAAMSAPAVTVKRDASIAIAIGHFLRERIGALPVVDAQGRLVGIVSYMDVLGALFPRAAPTPAGSPGRP